MPLGSGAPEETCQLTLPWRGHRIRGPVVLCQVTSVSAPSGAARTRGDVRRWPTPFARHLASSRSVVVTTDSTSRRFVRLHSRSALVRHRAARDSRSISTPHLPDSTTNMLFLGRPISVNQYTVGKYGSLAVIERPIVAQFHGGHNYEQVATLCSKQTWSPALRSLPSLSRPYEPSRSTLRGTIR